MIRKAPFPDQLYKEMPRATLNIVTRKEWGAEQPIVEEKFTEYPVPSVVFGYTETEPCMSKDQCMKTMRELQKLHKAEGLADIRYSYVVGGDGNIYEGRGWHVRAGKHYRFSDLNGDNYEVVHTAKRGKLPNPELSMLAWQLLDKAMFDGLLKSAPHFFQDFEDPPPPVDLDNLDMGEGEIVDVMDCLKSTD